MKVLLFFSFLNSYYMLLIFDNVLLLFQYFSVLLVLCVMILTNLYQNMWYFIIFRLFGTCPFFA